MRSEHSGVLACVRCRSTLGLDAEQTADDGHVIRGTLTCAGCAAQYAVVRGVPRLMPEALPDHVDRTVQGFGYQWKQGNSFLKHAQFFAPATFLDFIRPVPSEWFAGKTVLDAGCGTGRFTRLSAQFGARLVVGVDLGEAVEVAFENTRHLPDVLIVQGDILRLPLQPVFDYAFSIGVLHHTADPRSAFLQLASKVRPGGGVSAWVYGAENNGWVVRAVSPVRRITSRMPRPLLMLAAHLAALPLTAAIKFVYAPVARRPSLACLRSRLFYFDYFVFLSQFSYREHAIVVFDHLVPAISEYIPRADFAEWFSAAGLEQIVITARAGNSWRGFGLVVSA